jgi:hypothetical protein
VTRQSRLPSFRTLDGSETAHVVKSRGWQNVVDDMVGGLGRDSVALSVARRLSARACACVCGQSAGRSEMSNTAHDDLPFVVSVTRALGGQADVRSPARSDQPNGDDSTRGVGACGGRSVGEVAAEGGESVGGPPTAARAAGGDLPDDELSKVNNGASLNHCISSRSRAKTSLLRPSVEIDVTSIPND